MLTSSIILAVIPTLLFGSAVAEPVVLDDGASTAGWSVVAPEGVTGSLSTVEGPAGLAVRLDFDFVTGGGYCVMRRTLPMPLPGNYGWSFDLRADAPVNNFEFKLVDPSGQNVWWKVRRDYAFPRDWTTLRYKKRHFRFAWGPSAGAELTELGAIEFAVSAGTGGKGWIAIDNLRFESLPPADTPMPAPQLTASSPPDAVLQLAEDGALHWRSAASDPAPTLEIDFRRRREFGGLLIAWDPHDFARDYDVETSDDGVQWMTAARIRDGNGRRDYVPLPDAEAARLRLRALATSRGEGVAIERLVIEPPEFAETPSALFETVARESPRGLFPRYLLGEAAPWIVVGVADDAREGLLGADGALEVDKAAFTVEPFIWSDGRLISWADVRTAHTLAEGYLPIPTVTWTAGDLRLEITAFADGEIGASVLQARYVLTNRGAARRSGSLALAVRPFQVLPPWQQLNVVGGVSPIGTIEYDGRRVVVDGKRALLPWTPPSAFGAAARVQGEIGEYLAAGQLPPRARVTDSDRLASAALRYDFDLEPGQAKTVAISAPLHDAEPAGEPPGDEAGAAQRFEARRRACVAGWTKPLNRVGLELPPSAADLVNTFRTTQAYVLINGDGPAIQPGSRSYERSWMRDGALTSNALLATGHPEKVRAFLEWYSRYQYPSGNVPCVVDARGPDAMPEYDSLGEFIYAFCTYYRFTRDRAFLEAHLPQIERAVDYIEELRSRRLTDEYKNGPPEKRVCYGLVPESGSHEGYLDVFRHSYWDGFFVIKGLKDAVYIAQVLGRSDLEARFAALRDAYRQAMYDSIRLAMKLHDIDYVPGCAELGDFDATSTTIGLWPCGELGFIPEPALHNTFERYYDFFVRRRDGATEWEAYTPYEVRAIGSFVLLGQRARAHELADYFLSHRRPQGWNAWAEVVWRDPLTPKLIGDIPHTWVGSDFVNAVRSMFVHERDRDDALVLAAGVLPEWLTEPPGVRIADFPTPYGPLSYTLRTDGRTVLLDLQTRIDVPPGGIEVQLPDMGAIQAVTVDGQPHADFGGHEITLRQAPARVEILYEEIRGRESFIDAD